MAAQSSVSFLQTPAWAQVKAEWRAESLGWFEGETLRGAALVLYRQLPRIKRYLAYLPEGPVVDWDADDLSSWLVPLSAHLKAKGAFAIRMGPPVIVRRWSAEQIKAAIADEGVHRLREVEPLHRDQTGARVVSQLLEQGWRPQSVDGGFAAGQPQFNFVIPLIDEAGQPRTEDDILKSMNLTLWLARHEGDLVAATIAIGVGAHAWDSYGASSTDKREVRGSNAVQWEMIRDALAHGAHVYDLRGITETLDATDSHVGLIQFKVGTGGEAVEYVGEWDLPINKVLYKAFEIYLARRG